MNKIRLLESNLPMRLRGLRLVSPAIDAMVVDPPGKLEAYAASVRAGEVVMAQGAYETCGKGLWVSGAGSTALLAALLQDLMDTDETGAALLYLNCEEYLESMRPEGDRKYAERALSDHLLLLSHVPTLKFVTDWGRGTVASLISRRFDAGLPTFVASEAKPTDYLDLGLAREAFRLLAIMGKS